MNPKLFGRTLWIIMFEYLYKYNNDIERIKSFYWLISNVIPCNKCSNHFKKAIYEYNILSTNDWKHIRDFTISLYNTMHIKKIFLNENE
jgi:hypothetical protein